MANIALDSEADHWHLGFRSHGLLMTEENEEQLCWIVPGGGDDW